jgi:hypothetical protein
MRTAHLLVLLPVLGCSAVLDYPRKQPAVDTGTDAPADTTHETDAADTPADDVSTDTTDDEPACEGLAPRISDVAITTSSLWAYNASLVWTGSEFGLAWFDNRATTNEVHFARLDTDGVKIGFDTMVSDSGGTSVNPAVAFTGTAFGVTWQDGSSSGNAISFAQLDTSGTKVGGTVEVASASSHALYPDIAWSGSQFLVAWHDDRDGEYDIYFAILSPSGTPAGAESKLNETTTSATYSSVAWAGSQYGVAWEDNRLGAKQIYLARVTSWGSKSGSDLRVSTGGTSSFVSMAWSGSEFGIAWQDTRSPTSEIFMRRVDGLGATVGTDVRLTSAESTAEYADVVWTGSLYAVAWDDNRTGTNQIYLGLVDPTGARIGSDVRVTDTISWGDEPSLAWTGSELGIAWVDDRDGNRVIYFTIVSPCP